MAVAEALERVDCELRGANGVGGVNLKGFVGIGGFFVDCFFGVPEVGPFLSFSSALASFIVH